MNAWPIYRDGRVELVQTSHQQLAIRAAQTGNWKPADSLELDRLRQFVKPHDAEGEPHPFPNLRPVEIRRSCGPNGEDVAIWEWTQTCGACEGSGYMDFDFNGDFERDGCTGCGGTGIDEEPAQLITDLNGLILENRLP